MLINQTPILGPESPPPRGSDPAVSDAERIAAATGLPNAIEAAVARLDWPTACTLFAKHQESVPRDWKETGLLAASLMDWVTVLRAESAYISESGLTGPDQLPPRLARVAFQARLQLKLVEEALDLARACRRRFSGQQAWAKREARALTLLGDDEAALAIGIEAWRAGQGFGAALVARKLIALGQMAECERFLIKAEHGLSAADRRRSLTRARMAYWTASSDHALALDAVLQLAAQTPVPEHHMTVARYAALARDEERLDGLLAQVAHWSGDPAFDTLFRQAAPAILGYHYQRFFNWPAVRPWIEVLSAKVLAPAAARAVCKLALRAGEYRLAEGVAHEALRWFPSTLMVWQLHLHLLHLQPEAEGLDAARQAMKRRFPAESYLAATSVADSRTWDLDDLPELLTFNLTRESSKQQVRFFKSLGEAALTEAHVDLLRGAAADASPIIAAQADLLLTPLTDRRLLQDAVFAPVNFAEFERNRTLALRRMTPLMRDLAVPSGQHTQSDHGMSECLRLTAGLREDRPATLLFTRETYAESAALAHVLIERIERRQPTSVIRIGDGEGHFLPCHPAVSDRMEVNRAQIQATWWGSTRLKGDRLKTIQDNFVEAVNNSSIIGVVPPWRIVSDMSKKGKMGARGNGILNAISYVASMPCHDALLTSAHFPNDLHNWNLWGEFFVAVRAVSYISCHDMVPFLRETFGVETRLAIEIPPEHKYGALFGQKSDHLAVADTLLDRHEAVCSAIDPLPGEVFLVAAGFLGKIYCEIVRSRGGVGIDIGSLADYWMGFATRRYRLEQHSDIGLPNSLVEDHPLARRHEQARIIGSAGVVRSTADCRYNIADAADEARPSIAPRERALLRVIGHPRCASGYMASLLTGLGLEIGHERLLRDGLSSWMHAVADLHVPYGDNASYAVDFEHTVAHVRDPADAIPSIMLENGQSRSFNFRRLHILRARGVDISSYATAMDRAVASLVHWYDIVMQLRPEAVFRVEDAEGAARDYLARTDLVNVGRRGARAPRATLLATRGISATDLVAGIDPEEESESLEMAGVNSSIRKFVRAKPVLSKDAYARLDVELRERLEAYCMRFNYARPW